MKRIVNRGTQAAFALPTVMIASVVMLMVLLSGLVASSSVNTALKRQYEDRALKMTMESAATMAKACLAKNNSVITWSSVKPLKPNTDCNGTESTSCTASDTRDVCYVYNLTNTKTTFTVGVTNDTSGNPSAFDINATLNQFRTSGGVSSTLTDTKSLSYSKTLVLSQTHGLSIGDTHSCGITTLSQAYCWGGNNGGKLGNNTTATSLVPVAVSQGSIPAGVKLESIGVGQYASCGIGSDGEAYCWGTNTYGQLGNNSTVNSSVPVAVAQGAVPAGVKFVHINGGQHHTCALGSDGEAYCWGYNSGGQLGNNSTVNSSVPVAVAQGAVPAGVKFVSLVTKLFSTCALGSDYKAYCWGQNGSNGTLGTGSTSGALTPVAVAQGAIPAGIGLKYLSVGGSYHVCSVATNDWIYCWGSNANAQLGTGNTTDALSPVAVSQGAIPAGTKIDRIEAGYANTCAISTISKAYCWGFGVNGQLGNGASTSSSTPVAVSQGDIPAGVGITNIYVGTYHVCALSLQHKAYCWGYNASGQVGNNTTTNASVPTAVSQNRDWNFATNDVEKLLIY